MTQNEIDEVRQVWQKPNTATALEQTWHNDGDGKECNQNKGLEKLHFAKDVHVGAPCPAEHQ